MKFSSLEGTYVLYIKSLKATDPHRMHRTQRILVCLEQKLIPLIQLCPLIHPTDRNIGNASVRCVPMTSYGMRGMPICTALLCLLLCSVCREWPDRSERGVGDGSGTPSLSGVSGSPSAFSSVFLDPPDPLPVDSRTFILRDIIHTSNTISTKAQMTAMQEPAASTMNTPPTFANTKG
ncbi:hypothetical protein SFRURICE_010793 [Spodoptera frugiperda]|nr:hypothetical protein SFRURICE_010793 [Spodoptera frugiperda]